MFNKQINIWNTIAPQQTLTNLIDSDHFSIKREVEFLKSTGLFSSFVITDNKKAIIAQLGDAIFLDSSLISIQDDAKVIWGYYYFKPDFYRFISPFLFAAGIFFTLILLVYAVIRWRIRVSLEFEFSKFNKFLAEIEKVTQQLHEIYHDDAEFEIDLASTYSSEQLIINKAISSLLGEIKNANISLREAVSQAEQRRFQEELTRTALQVVHDIGSSLAILDVIQRDSLKLPEDIRILIRNATTKIRDIINTLLKKARHDFSSNNNLIQQMLYLIISQVINEKRFQHGKGVNIDFQVKKDSYLLFAFLKPVDFSRVLSNLINNAIEAIQNDNRIVLSLAQSDKEVIIEIKDHGRGIPKDILSKIGDLGVSFGKSQGTGIGLNHAISTIEDWGGKLEIQSEEGKGTAARIFLPKCNPPSWFVSALKISNGQVIVIIDDDSSIHTAWEMKLAEFKQQANIDITTFHFYSPEEVLEWKISSAENLSILYLCDYEFVNSSINGIDLIQRLEMNYLSMSILVTGSMAEELVSRCEIENIKLLPKDIVGIIPILCEGL